MNVALQRWLILGLFFGAAYAQRPTEIAFWHTLDSPGREALEKIVGEFNGRQRDYRIAAQYVGDLREGGIKLTSAIRAGNPPQLYYGEISFVSRAVQENLALPLDEYLGNLPTDFYPGLLETGRFRGRTHALPVELHLPVLFYNADQLAARRQSPPQTWEALAAVAEQLTTRAARGFTVVSDIYSFNAVVMSRGGQLVRDGRPNFTDAKVVQSLEYLQSLVRAGSAQSRNIAEAQFALVDFVRTKTFMGIAPVTVWPVLEKRTPIPFRLGVAPLPRTPDGKLPLAGGNLMVLRGASEAQARGVVALWRYWMEPANIAEWVRATYCLPLRRSAQPLLEDFYREDPRRRVAFGGLEQAQTWVQDPEVTLWYGFLEEALERVLKGNANPRQALEEAQRKALAVERR
ncbi:extracellular solute-binding protein [Meiothermus hypogaeus]|uniref:Sugar ABC transporter substrate-binding protein n=2 Tax=Meiothermus hypogaeus TaxID=884155 RepID=A0A511R0F7_9DEIN|nr:extracellular solute-binding protein [Meiothermus hypogaeus]RIH77572.1 sn-glycerol-3-phosphate-binding periplasmic protein UgpB [Meiothermus hypogaeus]GEM83090.1 sugar ABC transporter substrate-binding protein [Meiothermus hypogaeus NBRC 106114]